MRRENIKKDKFVRFDEGVKYTTKKGDAREISDNCDAFIDAGYVLKSSDFIVDIDCLNQTQIEALIKTFNIKTQIVWTDRGAHLYFKKKEGFTRSRGTCALGFPVEYKHVDNTYAITIKRDGKMREIENEGVREPLPNYFQTIKTKRSMLGLEEGDGRNEALYELKRMIVKFGNVRKILGYVNDYLFAEPLSDREFEVVARDEVIQAEKDGENVIADLIAREKKVVLYANSLYFYDGISYSNDQNEIKRMVYTYCPDQKTRYVDEVISQMAYRCERIPSDTEFKINFKNGYVYQGEFFPYQYRGFTPYYIPLEYHRNAMPVPIVDDYLNQLSNDDENYKDFILEIIASSLIVNSEFKRLLSKFFIFVGSGGNGKGTLLLIIRNILGKQNVSASSISELEDERYLNNLIGKLANLGDDIQNEPINRKQMKILKNLSSGDSIQVRRLYQDAFTTYLNPTLIFTSNHKVKTFDKDYSYKRRVVWCPMYTKPEVVDPEFISKLTTPEALEYWIYLIIEAYKRLYRNKKFTESDIVKNFTEEYHRENDSTIEYTELLDLEDIQFKRPPEVYEQYEIWCENNGETCQSKSRLREQIMNRGFIVKQVKRKGINGGISAKVYVKEDKNG